ncbi:phosphatase PAP2 family protein [Henriciella marina]|uniref:phosphatase PAP2 family protein n=1 Tax=Henriciella marina TaxID=453851 RepID=UPI0003A8356B|nr:phosphatase PAP2 family protein [Henriciella marina]
MMADGHRRSRRTARRRAQTISRHGPLHRADLKLSLAIGALRRNRTARRLAEAGELADQPPMIAGCLSVIAAGMLSRERRLHQTGWRMLAAFSGATAVKTIGKKSIARTRPWKLDETGYYQMRSGGPSGKDWESFPSGHTAASVAVARAVGRDYPALEAPGLVAGVSAGMLKVVKGDHYIGDVVAGFLLGLGVEALTHRATRHWLK